MITADSLKTADSAMITCDGSEHSIGRTHGAVAGITSLHAAGGSVTKHGGARSITAHGASVALLRHSALNSLSRH